MPNSANSEHRAMGWATIGGALMSVGAVAGISLGVWGAGAHLWGDDYFLAGFAAAVSLAIFGIYVLWAEFIGGVGPIKFPLPPTRREREAPKPKVVSRAAPQLPHAGTQQQSPPRPRRSTADMRREAARRAVRDTSQRAQSAESNSGAALADRLARLHSEGRKLRQSIKPDLWDPRQTLGFGKIIVYPATPVSAEWNARQWAEKVQNQLALSATRFVPEWEDIPALPLPVPMSMSGVADGRALVRFLDARLGFLENIIGELREGR